ncbi:hypothetical protein CN553_12155 [Bacillus cereus]|uniref:Uncharacterized protein n=1 Tax=Bacillus cereus TaxID=1396 RepID=A0A9X6YM89_BACCE|nr:hypothetical protein [Bacillus cereus]PEN97797.1 hypothetical protein CN553_12155 [Bacillus cereus]
MLFVKKEFVPEIKQAKTFDEFCKLYKKLGKNNNAVNLNTFDMMQPYAQNYIGNPDYVEMQFIVE